MARNSIWSGMLTFVLVSIPVHIVPAVRPKRTTFNLLHRGDHARIRRRMFCPADQTYVHPEHILNGYPVDGDRYVIVRDEEYEAIEPKRSQAIEIETFVDFDQIAPVYYDRPYYLVPKKGGEKPYRLLHESMKSTQRAGIARLVLRDRQYLVAVWPLEKTLGLMLLHFAQQIRDPRQFAPAVKADAESVSKITRVMKSKTIDYDPDNYTDEYRVHLLEFLDQKAKQGQVVTAPQAEEEEEKTEPVESEQDLIAALEESLSHARG